MPAAEGHGAFKRRNLATEDELRKSLAGAEEVGLLYAISKEGKVTSYSVGVNIEDIDLLAAGKSLPPMSSSVPPAPPAPPQPRQDSLPQRAPILGVPPAEPMGA